MPRKYVKVKKKHISPWTLSKKYRKNKEYKKTSWGKSRQQLANWRAAGIRFGEKNYMFPVVYNDYKSQTNCECCGKPFKNKFDKTLDHDHGIENEYNIRGIICRSCNLRREDYAFSNNTGVRNVYRVKCGNYIVYYVVFNVEGENLLTKTFSKLECAVKCRDEFVAKNPFVYT